MTSHEPKVALTYRDKHTSPNNERVGHQRMNPSRSKLQGLKGTTRDISPKGQTQEQRVQAPAIHLWTGASIAELEYML